MPASSRNRLYKVSLLAGAAVLLTVAGGVQQRLNTQRLDPVLGQNRVAPLENAPPMLAFTTVALGGFRGLIANALWMRASELQEEGKYFELVQLADWITKLEPHFVEVWLFQAWNMSYNISVKFADFADRWRWVRKGIELLRDDALRLNPKEARLYRELAWHFQHKMGQNLDDAHQYYKAEWAREMTRLLGSGRPDFDALIQPKAPEDQQRARMLREIYKMDPQFMKQVDQAYDTLDWRLPETHAIYWAEQGLTNSTRKDLMTLRRVIYQCLPVLVLRGRLLALPTNAPPHFGADLNKINRASAAYEQMMAEEPGMRDSIQKAHRNFLRQAVTLLYTHGRTTEADRLFKILTEKYPDAVPSGLTAQQYTILRVAGDISTLTLDRARAFIEGLILQSYESLILEDDERANGLMGMAQYLWNAYSDKNRQRLALPPFPDMRKAVQNRLLDPEAGLPPEYAARLRTRLDLPPPAASTNAPPK
jgi:hypothetical protein